MLAGAARDLAYRKEVSTRRDGRLPHRQMPVLPWLRRDCGEPFGFATFVLVKESNELPAMRLFLRSDFQNEILRDQINRITHFDKFFVLIDRFILGTNHTPNYGDHVSAVLG